MTDEWNATWKWICAYEREPIKPPEPIIYDELYIDPFLSYDDKWIEMLIWFTFLWGIFWIFGAPFFYILGIVVECWYIYKWWTGLIMVFDASDEDINFGTFIIF